MFAFLLLMSATACGEAGKTITRLAVGDPGPDPYTLAANADDDEQVDRRAEAGGQVKGDAPGLYGGTRKAAACDKDALVEFLQAGGEKAGAWSGVLGITVAEIPGFVADLTPAVLRVDTLVTNHGYRDGTATAIPAVLQAGIAVLVDRHGVPVVKCNCGNPLTPPDAEIDPKNSDFRGASWPQFSGGKVTVIATPEQEVKSLTLVDSETETAFERPAGSGGDRDGAAVPIPPAARSEPPLSTSGQTTGPATSGPATSGGVTPTRSGTPTGTPTDSPTDSPAPEESATEDGATGKPSATPGVRVPEKSPTAEAEEAPATGTEKPAEAAGPDEPAGGTTVPAPEPEQTRPQQSEQATRPAEPEPSDPGPGTTGG
ncbi:hypothetical protein GCM10009550_13280 [Actinocorallia libanotica]|uniref:DUF6777 domain-containing protein n=1 Tax=Actinocorallia libanotica TaxID=46162 RepID=A0ABP4B0A3_9ACTN